MTCRMTRFKSSLVHFLKSYSFHKMYEKHTMEHGDVGRELPLVGGNEVEIEAKS